MEVVLCHGSKQTRQASNIFSRNRGLLICQPGLQDDCVTPYGFAEPFNRRLSESGGICVYCDLRRIYFAAMFDG